MSNLQLCYSQSCPHQTAFTGWVGLLLTSDLYLGICAVPLELFLQYSTTHSVVSSKIHSVTLLLFRTGTAKRFHLSTNCRAGSIHPSVCLLSITTTPTVPMWARNPPLRMNLRSGTCWNSSAGPALRLTLDQPPWGRRATLSTACSQYFPLKKEGSGTWAIS